MSTPIIRLEALSKVYRMGSIEVHALRPSSLSVAPGEMLAVMGPSGSGKSTLLNLIGTLDHPTSGRYFLDGDAVEELDEEELASLRNRKIGFVFQAFNLMPRETALANVELPLMYAGVSTRERRERARLALERVGLSERADHLPNQLSGGQQQRVSLARAIVNRPLLLLADEPTGALDSATTREVMALLCELHRHGMTVLLVTHDPSVARYAERVITFRDGSLINDVREPASRPQQTVVASESTPG
jgi:putative ABC transport system ATP-binding protein